MLIFDEMDVIKRKLIFLCDADITCFLIDFSPILKYHDIKFGIGDSKKTQA